MSKNQSRFTTPPKLTVPNPERLINAGRAFRERQNYFFGEARIPRNYGGYFMIFHHALEMVEFTASQDATYQKWLAMDNDTAVEAGWEAAPITNPQLRELAEDNDPAAYLIGKVVELRPGHPNIQRDEVVINKIFTACGLFAAGVHRDHVFVT